jgi:hypothetical protein
VLNDKDRSVNISGQARDDRTERSDATGGRAYHNDVVTDHHLFMRETVRFVKV